MRLFIALPLSDGMRRVLLDAQRDMRAQGVRANFSREENLHLTLAFLGEVEGGNVRAAQEAVLSLEGEGFPLTLERLGNFGSLYWAGLRKSAPLERLAGQVRRALDQRGLDYDRKPFRGHITLARQVRASEPFRIELPPAEMTADRVVLMCSERIEGKLTYTPVAERRLNGYKQG